MSNKHIIILGTAFNPTQKQVTAFGQERIRQYVEGLGKIAELAEKFPVFDYVLADNTIGPSWKMPMEIEQALKKIPRLKTVMFYGNALADKNKGAGVLVALKKLQTERILDSYEYCLYFEPRQLLTSFDFFQRFVSRPANYFKIGGYRMLGKTKPWPIRMLLKIFPLYRKQLDMGLMSIETGAFLEYIKNASPEDLEKKNISLEDDLYDKLHFLEFIEVKKLGFIWHNAFTGEDIQF